MSKRKSLEARKALAGRLFVYPWVIGFLLFLAKPLVQSVIYSFNTLRITKDGLLSTPVGLKNYSYVFSGDPKFMQYLITSVRTTIIDVPLIIFFSLFIAVLLNRKFRGRAVIRGIFFLPVIITSGALVYVLGNDVSTTFQGAAQTTGMPMVKAVNFQVLLSTVITYKPAVDQIVAIIDRVYVIIWKSGVQILMFLAGLQAISPSLYESSDVEGATAWESFWKITMPMISPIIIINVVYTVIDSFTDYNNQMLRYILDITFLKIQYGISAAMAWVYFSVILVLLAVSVGIISKKAFYMND